MPSVHLSKTIIYQLLRFHKFYKNIRGNCESPESEGVIAKSKCGSSTPAATGIATTLYATAQDKF
ncbi:hypothetical protein Hdeb2414_s0030g00708991 [Helianthus debilis subsp. tardiflorus]